MSCEHPVPLLHCLTLEGRTLGPHNWSSRSQWVDVEPTNEWTAEQQGGWASIYPFITAPHVEGIPPGLFSSPLRCSQPISKSSVSTPKPFPSPPLSPAPSWPPWSAVWAATISYPQLASQLPFLALASSSLHSSRHDLQKQ